MNTYSTPISNLSSLGYGPPSPLYLPCFPHHKRNREICTEINKLHVTEHVTCWDFTSD